jgi:protein-S-isoprenylcysteine O-methyltransferase Ste14
MTGQVSYTDIAVRLVFAFLFITACLFGTAGTFRWAGAWLYIVLQFFYSTFLSIWLKKYNPDLLIKRMQFMQKGLKSWDKAILISSLPVSIALISIPGLDAVRYQWSYIPWLFSLFGFSGFVLSLVIVFLVMKENTYLSHFVEIQEGHKVITTGPYQYIRHPMYLAIILYSLCFPLALRSLYGLLPGGMLVLLIIIRTALEDRTLHNELQGYKEYATRVRFRLIPGIW